MAQGHKPVNVAGCDFDSHSRKFNVYYFLYQLLAVSRTQQDRHSVGTRVVLRHSVPLIFVSSLY